MSANRYDAHRRGTLTLPHECLIGAAGDLAPGYVCCSCGGVELSEYGLSLNHGCCDGCRAWRNGDCRASTKDGFRYRYNHLWTDGPVVQLDLLDLLEVAND